MPNHVGISCASHRETAHRFDRTTGAIGQGHRAERLAHLGQADRDHQLRAFPAVLGPGSAGERGPRQLDQADLIGAGQRLGDRALR